MESKITKDELFEKIIQNKKFKENIIDEMERTKWVFDKIYEANIEDNIFEEDDFVELAEKNNFDIDLIKDQLVRYFTQFVNINSEKELFEKLGDFKSIDFFDFYEDFIDIDFNELNEILGDGSLPMKEIIENHTYVNVDDFMDEDDYKIKRKIENADFDIVEVLTDINESNNFSKEEIKLAEKTLNLIKLKTGIDSKVLFNSAVFNSDSDKYQSLTIFKYHNEDDSYYWTLPVEIEEEIELEYSNGDLKFNLQEVCNIISEHFSDYDNCNEFVEEDIDDLLLSKEEKKKNNHTQG